MNLGILARRDSLPVLHEGARNGQSAGRWYASV